MILLVIIFFIFHTFSSANCHLPARKGYPAPSAEKPPSSPGSAEQYFEQKLDHFTESETRTWKQLYYADTSFYTAGGPAYLWLGEEGPIMSDDLEVFYWSEHGKKVGAIVFRIEHRYYGSSQPLGDLSLENLGFLTIAQALADFAAFITGMNEKHKLPTDIKWFVFGGSYVGNLSAWMREKYPDLVHGAVASSAPINIKVDNPEYFDATVERMTCYKKECTDDIGKANQELEKKLETPEGLEEIGKIFNLCAPLTGEKLDSALFLYNMAIYFGDALQNSKTEADANGICDKMLEDAKNVDPLQRYSNTVNWLVENYGDKCLFTSFKDYATIYTSTDSFDFESMAFLTDRQWKYQQCTELGQNQIIGPNNAVFSKLISSEFYEGLCIEAFGEAYNLSFTSNGVDSTTQNFGGLHISASRIVFVNGLNDPWHGASITSPDQNSNVEIIVIKGSGHGDDLYTSSDSSPKELKEAQKQLASIIDGWMEEPK